MGREEKRRTELKIDRRKGRWERKRREEDGKKGGRGEGKNRTEDRWERKGRGRAEEYSIR